MRTSKKIINKDQYLADIMDALPSNTIIFKTATGIGATHLELQCERNSIIIEPNVPVIKGKKRRGIFGVYEGIDVSHIMDYLRNTNFFYKKILVTPESFGKVKEAAENLNINLHTDYFLLFDECDRTMKDVNYRDSILLPMMDFFLFDQKAFISATAVVPSDPRFIEYEFEHLTIEPSYSLRKAIDLITTNNVSMTLKSQIMNCLSDCICIFFNSIQGISSIIKDLGIADETNIYCSKKKATELSAMGIKRAHENLTPKLAKYNFFTSRFNAAVDIPDVEPTVIMVTNLHVAHHTVIDPGNDAIQIVGRFRKGVEHIIAISNFDENLHAKTPQEAISYLKGCEESYNIIKTLRNSTTREGALETLNEALELVKYSSFVNEDGTKNHFMVDNFLYGEAVKMLFKTPSALEKAYHSNHFDPRVVHENYRYSDAEDPRSSSTSSTKELTGVIINALRKLEDDQGFIYSIDNSQNIIQDIRLVFPEIVEGYYVLGAEELSKNCYSKKQIIDAIKRKKAEAEKSDFNFIKALQGTFLDGFAAPSSVIKRKFGAVIEIHGLSLRPEIVLLRDYFEISPRTSIKGYKEKGYRILSSKFKR